MENEASVMMIDLSKCWIALRRNFLSIVLFAVLGLFIACALTVNPKPDVYGATASISGTTFASSGRQVTLSTIKEYADILTSTTVLEKAAILMDDPDITVGSLSSGISAKPSAVGSILYISATSQDPIQAIRIVNTVTEVLVAETTAFLGVDSIKVLDKANAASMVSDGRLNQIITRAAGMVIVGMLACIYYVAVSIFSRKTMTIRDFQMDGTLEVLGVIPFIAEKR